MTFKIATSILLVLLNITAVKPAPAYVKYNNSRFSYSFMVPENWEKEELDLVYSHVLTVSRDSKTEIKVSASVADDEENDKWNSIMDWYTIGIGSKMKLILEKKKFKINESARSRLLVFQYRLGRVRMLKRMTITRVKDIIIVMECSAPVKTFYRYDRIFNTVMGSITTNP